MRKFAIASLVLIGSLFSGTFLPAGKEPKIEFKHESKDFGQVKQGKVLGYVFQFRNAGDATLVVQRVRTSCGCTAALVSKSELKPGEAGEIKVTFNTRGYAGSNSKYIYVESNDPDAPQKQLTVKASIDVPPSPRLELDNYSVDLGLLLEDDELQTEVLIKNTGSLELTVTPSHRDAAYSIDGKPVSGEIEIPAKKSVQVQIKIPPRKNKGLIREYILLRSNDPIRSNLSVYLSGYIVSKAQLKELFAKYKKIID
ncbi:MAG: DUF1573 domain-containing protein [Candidatus Aminicenantes bacterium]|nr:DUF1573 domain-containing protein [Candidatus Aminicenantes bacterium]